MYETLRRALVYSVPALSHRSIQLQKAGCVVGVAVDSGPRRFFHMSLGVVGKPVYLGNCFFVVTMSQDFDRPLHPLFIEIRIGARVRSIVSQHAGRLKFTWEVLPLLWGDTVCEDSAVCRGSHCCSSICSAQLIWSCWK